MQAIVVRRLFVCLLLIVMSTALQAEQNPTVERGFQPGKLYQFLDLDSINLFNGNLTIRIPIGLQYANNGSMTYGLALTYNSKVWDFRKEVVVPPCPSPDLPCEDPYEIDLGLPNRTSNAGLGWSVSMGRLISPDDPINDSFLISGSHSKQQGCVHKFPYDPNNPTVPPDPGFVCDSFVNWQYESPDGATTTVHPQETLAFRPYGPSAIRMLRTDATTIELHFMDGSVHTFRDLTTSRGGWILKKIVDAFDNTIDIDYDADSWTITDSFGRETTVNFTKTTDNTQPNYARLLDSIVLPAPQSAPGGTMTYSFQYELGANNAGAPVHRPCATMLPPGFETALDVPLLKKIVVPDHDHNNNTSSFEFDYSLGLSTCDDAAIRSMTLPTGGMVRWQHGGILIAASECQIRGWSSTMGVTKREFVAGNAVVSTWAYQHHIDKVDDNNVCSTCANGTIRACKPGDPDCGIKSQPRREKRTIVTAPDGNKVEHFFSIVPKDMPVENTNCELSDPDAFGQPFTSSDYITLTNDKRAFLSTIMYERVGNQDVERRRTYVLYDKIPRYLTTNNVDVGEFDWRVKSERTVFRDDGSSYIETNRDNLTAGHYAVEETRSSFDPTVRSTTTSYVEFPGDDRYILGRYTQVVTQQGSEKARSYFCFDSATGFLTATRTVRDKSGDAAAGDVVAIFKDDDGDGNAEGEQWGLATDTTTSACEVKTGSKFTLQYDLTHTYDRGVRTSTQYAGVPFKSFQLTPDPNTGLPLTSIDAGGTVTTYTYDGFARLRTTTTGNVTTEYRYHNRAGSIANAFVEALRRDSIGGDAVTKYVYDLFGRVIQESSTMFDGSSSVRATTYNALGLRKTVSEAGDDAPHGKFTEFTYDAFSRLTSTTTADNKRSELAYTGVRETKRKTYVGRTLVEGAIPTVQDVLSVTTETYDPFGRLLIVEEPSGLSDAQEKTFYKYDVGNRLSRVDTGVQTRTFTYDAAGFLLSEDHPETAAITYGGYDARGHAETKTTGSATGPFRLKFDYDAAERLTEVQDVAASRPIQKYVFDALSETGRTAVSAPGRLLKATRFNYFPNGSSTLTYSVADYFTYDTFGRVTEKETVIARSDETTPVTFKNPTVYSYTPLSLPANVPYPTCTGCGGLELPQRNIVLSYAHGSLTKVGGFASLTYHPSGMLASVQHYAVNDDPIVLDQQLPDESGRPRPREITFSGVQDCSVITSQPVNTPVNTEGKATFHIAVTGDDVTVKWYQGRRGQTGPELGQGLSFTTPALTTTTQYWARATDGTGCVTDSLTVSALVCERARIISPAANELLHMNSGQPVKPQVVASGTGIRYRWTERINGGAETTLNSSTHFLDYTLPTVPANQATPTIVELKVTVLGGCSTGDEAVRLFTYSVTPPAATCPAFSLELDLPTPWLIFGDETSILQISVQGMLGTVPSPPEPPSTYTYQWYRNGQPFGGNSPTLAVSVNSWDVYWAKVTRTCNLPGNPKSEILSSKTYVYRWGTCDIPPVTVDQHTITLPAANPKIVAHCERPDVEYQWYKGPLGDTRVPIPGDAGRPSELTVGPVAGIYWLRVTAPCGNSADAGPFIAKAANCSPVIFSQHPQSADIAAGTTVTLFADANGNPTPHRFDWFETADPSRVIANGSLFTTRPIRTKTYSVTAVSTCSTAESMPARLRVTSCTDINVAAQPADASIPENTFANLSVSATAIETLRYQWYEGESGDDTRPVPGAVSPTLHVTPATTTKYWVRLSFDREGTCAVDSRTATVFVCRMPVLRPPLPAPISMYPNVPRWLAADVTGENLTYKWYQGSIGGTLIGEANMVRVQPAETTRYFVRVTSPCQSPVDDAVLDVGPIVYSVCAEIDTQPQPATVMLNASARLSVVASGAELRYEWYSIDPETGAQSGVLGTGSTFDTPPITKDLEFRVRVISGYCTKQSAKVLVTYCREPRVNWTKGLPQVRANQQQDLQVSITPIDAKLYWYRGTSGDVAGSTLLAGPTVNTAMYVGPATTTSYWVRAVKPNSTCHHDTPTFTVTVCMPQILQQPQGTLVNGGTSVRLTVGADGGTLTYQWYEGAAGVTTTPVGTNANFLDVTANTTKSYWVRVSGTCGAPVDSDVATVTVCTPPSITAQPTNVNAQAGAQFSLGVSATGTNLSYQWYQGAAGVTTTPVGDNSAIFTSSVHQTTDYWVKVTGMCGNAGSTAARVSIPPTINTQPANARITYNTTATLTVAATGTHLTYQWYRGSGTSQPVTGATSNSFTTPALTADTSYWVRVFSGAQPKDSNLATVTVCPAPVIAVSQPSMVAGAQVTLSVSSPYPGDIYTWYQGSAPNTAVSLGTGTSKVVSPTQTTSYWVRSNGATCYADSLTKVVTVCYPRIDAQPQGDMINPGGSKVLSVTAVGTPTLTYQWYIGESGNTAAPAPNGTASSITVSPNATTSYWVQVRSGAGGSCATNSNAATVSVCAPPAITGQPASVNGQAGVAFSLGVTATGTGLSYQWYQGAAGVTTTPVGDNSPNFSSTVSVTTDYWVKVTGTCGNVSSTTAKVSIPPTINTEPASKRITYNTTATLTVAATGTQLTYQWYRGNGTTQPVTGATSNSFTTPQLTADTSYWVRVYSGTQPKNSALATVTVCPAPAVSVSQPQLVAGSNVTLSVTNAYPGDTFTWYQGNAPSTATPIGSGPSKVVAPTQTTSYWVRATGATCYADSVTTTVTVCYPRIDAHPQGGTINPGGSITLSVAAVGTPTLTYQWYLGDSGNTSAPIGGATSSSLPVSPATATSYWVQIRGGTGGGCVTNSNAAVVTVCNPPVITQQPQPVVLTSYTTATFSVSATGDGLHYQWFHGPAGNTSTPVGEDSPMLSVPTSVTTYYWVRVSGTCGTVNSAAARVSVPPAINGEPADATFCKGQSATLSVTASGNELSYQWYEGPVGTRTKPLGTAATQVVSPTVTTTYFCDVFSGQSRATTRGAVMTVKATPTITGVFKTPMETCTRLTAYVASGDVGKVYYFFYRGAPGDTSNPLSSGTINYYDTCTDGTYWVRVQYMSQYGACSTNSAAVVVP